MSHMRNEDNRRNRSGRKRFTDAVVLEMLDKYNLGMTQAELAREYNTTSNYVYILLKRAEARG